MRKDTTKSTSRNNTLNLSPDRLHALMDELDAMSDRPNARRVHSRLGFRQQAIDVEVIQPSGGSVGFCVACRNISRGGMSVLHSAYMHLGTKCRVKLEHLRDGPQWIDAQVVQCRHVTGRAHDVGLKFSQEIDISHFVKIDPLDAHYSLERIDPDKLEGRVLLITASDIDRKLIEVYLSETSLRMVHVAEYGQAEKELQQPFNLVLIDFDRDPVEAARALHDMRTRGLPMPVVAISGDKSESTRQIIRDSKVSALIVKPVDKLTLLRALAEFIVLGRQIDNTTQPQTQSDPSLKALADLFAEDLQKFAAELEQGVEKDDEKSVRYICARIRGTGPLLGHSVVAEAANKVLMLLDQEGSLSSAATSVQTLVYLCRHARSAA